jgi:hypothetical protein
MPLTAPPNSAAPDIEQRWSLLQAKIAPHARLLAQQGSLASRLASGRRVWSLRFVAEMADGRIVQRSIYIGTDPELVNRAQQLLCQYRREPKEAKEMEALEGLAIAVGSATRAYLGPLRRQARRRRPGQWSKRSLF